MIRKTHLKADAPISIGILLSVALTLLVYLWNRSVFGPTIQADEGSYLANAAAIIGFPNDFASSYSAGYSIIISPAFILGREPDEIWGWVIVINALLYFFLVLGLWNLCSFLGVKSLSWQERLIPVTLVALYPMWTIMVGYSFAQLAFSVFTVWAVVFFCEASIHRRTFGWIIFGATIGYLPWIHPIGAVSAASASIALVFFSLKTKDPKPAFYTLTIIIFTIGVHKALFHPWLLSIMTIGGPPQLHYPRIANLFSQIWFADFWLDFISRIGGHVFLITIGTVGLLISGITRQLSFFSDKKHAGKYQTQDICRLALSTHLILSTLITILISCLWFATTPGANRLDHWLYGRYVEGTIAPLLLAGAINTKWIRARWVTLVAIISAALLSFGLNDYAHTANFNTSTFWQEFYIRDGGPFWWLLSGCALIFVCSLSGKYLGSTIICIFFIFCSYLQIHWHKSASKDARARVEATKYVRNNYPSGTCVGYDIPESVDYSKAIFWFDFGFQLYDYRLQRIDVKDWRAKCDGPLFTFRKNLNDGDFRAHIVAVSPSGGPSLWRKGPPPEAVYPLIISDRSVSLFQALLSGWHDIESDLVWSRDQAKLSIPISKTCEKITCEILLKFIVFGASPSRPVSVSFNTTNQRLHWENTVVVSTDDLVGIKVPVPQANGLLEISIVIPSAISPQVLNGTGDSRALGIGLKRIELLETQ
jgi:hypothetical protein